MSLRVRVLGSGSSGNAALFSAGTTHVLVDCGLAARTLTRHLRGAGLEPSSLSGIFVSHEHADHVRGLRVFLKKLKVPLFVAPECLHEANLAGVEPWHAEPLEGGRAVVLGGMTLTPFLVPHDAACCFGFSVESGGVRAVLATDLGEATALVRERLRGAHCQLVEFNHDLERLMAGSYPLDVKMRVRGRQGHLSNEQASRLVSQTVNGDTEALFLMHLSRDNNLPELALLFAREALAGRRTRLEVARPFEPTPAWES